MRRQTESREGPEERRAERAHLLPRFSLDRRVTVLVLLASVLVVGAVAALGIALELIPRGYSNPFLGVFAIWDDAPAQEVLEKVTLPLEEELSTVPGLAAINAYATTGFTRCFLQFKVGTDMDVAYREVRDRLERAKARMPDDVDRVLIQKEDESGFPVFMLGLVIDPEITDAYNLIQNEVILPLSRIDGVASVRAQGLEEKEVLIELDRERTAASGLNIYQLGQELADDNFTLASGSVYAGGKKLLLRSVAKYQDVEALENRLVAPSIRLKDVATVRYAVPESSYRARAMSRPAVAIVVLKEGEANAVKVADAVAEAVEKLGRNPRLTLVETKIFLNQAAIIRESLSTLLDSGRIGAIFAVLVLLFFLRRWRMTLIITLSIPLSMLLGLTAMYFAGETLNILSLLGLMISVGLLVDNSVVVAENIFRLHRDGLSRREACIRGAGEISLAIVMATLTTIIVFLPVSLVEGQAQFFLLRLSLPISVSLVASLLVALVFIPLSVYLTLPQRSRVQGPGPGGLRGRLQRAVQSGLRRGYEATFEPLNQGYTRILAFFLRRRMDLAVAIAVVVALTGAVVFRDDEDGVRLVQMQEGEQGGVEIEVVFPQSTTLEEAEDYFLTTEKVLEAQEKAYGLEGYFIFHRANFGEISVWFTNPRSSEMTPRQVADDLQERLPEKAGVRIFTGQERQEEKESQNVHAFTLHGEDAAQLEQVAEQLEGVFTGVEGVLGVQRSADPPVDEMALVVDRDRAQNLAINPQVVAGVVGYALRGQALPKFYRDGKEIPVRVRFEEADRERLDQLANFQVPTGTGEVVSLASITRSERLPVAKRIFRRDKQVARTITLDLEEGKEEATRERLTDLAAQIDLPEGVRFGAARSFGTQDEDVRSMLLAIGLSVIFIYLLMGFLFESFVLPLSILMTIPLALIGVGWVHFALGYDIDFLGMVGIVLLVGVVVNNGIVLIDYVNRLRAAGEERHEALLLAAERRFRPIMMTALTTISGMVPLTLEGATSIGLSYTSFGLTLIGGMASATFLTLLVVPVAYTLLDDLRHTLVAVLRRALGRAGDEELAAGRTS